MHTNIAVPGCMPPCCCDQSDASLLLQTLLRQALCTQYMSPMPPMPPPMPPPIAGLEASGASTTIACAFGTKRESERTVLFPFY